MPATHSRPARRGFVIGMTLNELAFLLFFLLVLISAHLLAAKDKQIAEKAARLEQMRHDLLAQQENLDDTFKKLGMLQDAFDRLRELQPQITPGELDQQFKRLVENENKVRADNDALRNRLQKLTEMLQAIELPMETDDSQSPLEKVRELLNRQSEIEAQKRDLEARLKILDARSAGSGLDHLPCWINSETGDIEYLYRVTILENRLKVDPAWPDSRATWVREADSFAKLANRTVSAQEFSRLADPILDWSRHQNPECRHFVRVRDDKATSKTAFKKQLRLIETFFYKYLEPDDS